MERVLFNAHSQICSYALRKTSSRVRSLAEHTLLLVGLCAFGVLIVSHISFVHRHSMSSSHPDQYWGRDTIRLSKSIPRTCLSGIPGFRQDVDLTHIILSPEETFAYTPSLEGAAGTNETKVDESSGRFTCSLTVSSGHDRSCTAMLAQNETVSLSYSRIKGFLLLSPEICAQHNISTQFVHVARHDTRCFGEPFLQMIVFHILGADTVILNWLLAAHDGQGYIYNARTKQMFDLLDYASPLWGRAEGMNDHYQYQLMFKLGVVLTSLFLFFITTTLVSFTLKETQDRMLEFTFQLQAHVQSHRPLGHLITTHVVESLVFVPVMVGMMFFLIEFYGGDKFLAFMVLSVVWVCEVFSSVSIRTSQGMQFFPKIFFLVFTAFHIYLFSCPFGFSYTALGSTICFMVHSMLFFWHRYELPAVARGLVTLERPRIGVTLSPPSVVAASNEELPHMPANLNESTEVPVLAPRHGLVRHPSNERSYTSMSSLGRSGLPRPSSTNVLFNDDDDGDDGSYMYFMDGEVVMHRNRQETMRTPSPMTQNGAASIGESHHGREAGDFDEVGDDTTSVEIPRRIMSTSLSAAGDDVAALDDGAQHENGGAVVHGLSNPAAASPARATVVRDQQPEPDATPRVENLSEHVHEEADAAAPLFPRFGGGVS